MEGESPKQFSVEDFIEDECEQDSEGSGDEEEDELERESDNENINEQSESELENNYNKHKKRKRSGTVHEDLREIVEFKRLEKRPPTINEEPSTPFTDEEEFQDPNQSHSIEEEQERPKNQGPFYVNDEIEEAPTRVVHEDILTQEEPREIASEDIPRAYEPLRREVLLNIGESNKRITHLKYKVQGRFRADTIDDETSVAADCYEKKYELLQEDELTVYKAHRDILVLEKENLFVQTEQSLALHDFNNLIDPQYLPKPFMNARSLSIMTETEDLFVKKMNRYLAHVSNGDSPKTIALKKFDTDKRQFYFEWYSPEQLRSRYKHSTIWVENKSLSMKKRFNERSAAQFSFGSIKKSDTITEKNVIDVWLSNPNHATYSATYFEPLPFDFLLYKNISLRNTPVLPTFTGYRINRDMVTGFTDPRKMGIFWNFLRYAVCSTDIEFAKLLKWIVTIFQNPQHQQYAPFLIGIGGVGKGVFGELLVNIIGKHAQLITNAENDVFGNFNSATEDKILMMLDELKLNANSSTYIKTLITDPVTRNRKMRTDTTFSPNFISWGGMSNIIKLFVHRGVDLEGLRRQFLLHVSHKTYLATGIFDQILQDSRINFWDVIGEELYNRTGEWKGAKTFANFAFNIDMSWFDETKCENTPLCDYTIHMSSDPILRWIVDCIRFGRIGAQDWNMMVHHLDQDGVELEVLYKFYLKTTGEYKEKNSKKTLSVPVEFVNSLESFLPDLVYEENNQEGVKVLVKESRVFISPTLDENRPQKPLIRWPSIAKTKSFLLKSRPYLKTIFECTESSLEEGIFKVCEKMKTIRLKNFTKGHLYCDETFKLNIPWSLIKNSKRMELRTARRTTKDDEVVPVDIHPRTFSNYSAWVEKLKGSMERPTDSTIDNSTWKTSLQVQLAYDNFMSDL